jgi:hypothetical protein
MNLRFNYTKPSLLRIDGKTILRYIVAFVLFGVASAQATIYVTADNGTTNLFGTLNIATGQFTQLNTTSPLFYALTTGRGGQIFGADANSGGLFKISPSGVTMPFGSVTAPSAFYGLAYSAATGSFFADNLGSTSVDLYSVAGDGNSSSFIKTLAGPNSGIFPTGNLAFGPHGTLYFNFSGDQINATNSKLYTVDTSTGALTAVGSGLGTTILTLFSDGKTLYGIDTFDTSGLGIFSINTTTGVATQISTVTGLPPSNDYFLDTATSSVPDTGSSLQLLSLALTVLIIGNGIRWRSTSC